MRVINYNGTDIEYNRNTVIGKPCSSGTTEFFCYGRNGV